MTGPDAGFEQVELATGNDIVGYYDRANDQAVVLALLPEQDNTVGAAITLANTTVEHARALIEAFRDLEARETAPSDDEQIIVAVRRGADETARWRLQPEQSSWQIAQIAEDLEDHLITLVEGNRKEDNE